jgi:hypothetical protein
MKKKMSGVNCYYEKTMCPAGHFVLFGNLEQLHQDDSVHYRGRTVHLRMQKKMSGVNCYYERTVCPAYHFVLFGNLEQLHQMTVFITEAGLSI